MYIYNLFYKTEFIQYTLFFWFCVVNIFLCLYVDIYLFFLKAQKKNLIHLHL